MTERRPEPTRETRADDPTTVLLAGSGGDERDSGACTDLVGATAPARTDLLLVSLGGDADGDVRTWSHVLGEAPAKVGVVTVEDERGAVAASGGADAAGGHGRGTGERSKADGPVVKTVSDPGDLQGVGEAVVSVLSSWAGDGNQVVVCVRSIDAVLEHDTPERTARFLDALSPHLESAGAVAHFHADVDRLDHSAFETLEPHFDEVVDAADSGRDDDRAGGFVFPGAESSEATGASSPAEDGEPSASTDGDVAESDADADATEAEQDADAEAPQSEVESAIVRVEQEGDDGPAVADAGATGAAASTGAAVDGPPSHSVPDETQRGGGGGASRSMLVTAVVGVVAVAAIAGAMGFFAPGSPAGEDGTDRGAVVGASNATITATQTARPTATATATASPTPTATPTPTPTPTATPTPTPTPTATPTASPTETETETETETDDGVIGGLL